MPPREPKKIANNKKAYHDFFIDEIFTAGIELTGTEVKSLRERGAQLRDSYASIRRGEIFLHGVHVSPYSHGNRENGDPDRVRRLLLHKKEIRYLGGKTAERGNTLVPLRMYFDENNRAKIEIGLARGKKTFDKRATIAERDQKRDVERALRDRNKA
ncbi:MAG: SsrA-binding protein SmpB [Actinobacteria bacterium]|nr:SsrA-binding protein SmpB [Actinomycetota bacterium]MCG2807581.1 SsrA-binding protein SmpB [Coriobacteriia bacterium]